ncbi:MAG: hypothetical protein H7Y10_03495 [Flavobacterium sp.]|nr:hypothetical protein [Flavobacterium sp.]
MKETQYTPKDKIENVRQVEVQKQLKLHHRETIKKGHTLFEINTATREVKKAEYETVNDAPYSKSRFAAVTKQRVIIRENCVYKSALNIENLFRKLGYSVKK